jgi:hypothetical protein
MFNLRVTAREARDLASERLDRGPARSLASLGVTE